MLEQQSYQSVSCMYLIIWNAKKYRDFDHICLNSPLKNLNLKKNVPAVNYNTSRWHVGALYYRGECIPALIIQYVQVCTHLSLFYIY